MTVDINTLIIAISSLLGGGSLGFFFTLRYARQKAQAEADGLILDNVQKAVEIWRELSVELQSEINKLKQEIEGIKANVCYKVNCPNREK